MDPHHVSEAWRALGQQLAQFRKAAGYTQHSLAPKALSARSTIANTEVGRQRPDRAFWGRCDALLDTGGVLTAGYDRVLVLQQQYRRDSSTAALHTTIARAEAACPPPTNQNQPPYRAPVQHEASARNSADNPDIVTAMAAQERIHQAHLSRRALLQAVPGSLMAALPETSPTHKTKTVRVDPAIVDHFTRMRCVLVESDNRIGAATILPTVRGQLGLIAEYRRATQRPLHNALLATEARWAEFTGWLSDDLGERAAGDWWIAQALTMAQEAGDTEFTGYVFARMAQRAAEALDQDRVHGLARAAARSGSKRAQVQAFATVHTAHAHAIDGNTSRFQAAINDAHHLIADIAPDQGLGAFCTTSYVRAHEGDCWLRLGRPHAAIECFHQALGTWPESYQRDRGLYLARTAAAHLAADEPEQAANTALAALELARLTRSTRVHHHVTTISNQLTAHTTAPAVAQLHAALTAAATPA